MSLTSCNFPQFAMLPLLHPDSLLLTPGEHPQVTGNAIPLAKSVLLNDVYSHSLESCLNVPIISLTPTLKWAYLHFMYLLLCYHGNFELELTSLIFQLRFSTH